MQTLEITITSRTRNLGFGWTNQPSGNGTAIANVTSPDKKGLTLKGLFNTSYETAQRNSGNSYLSTFFVGNQRIVGVYNAIESEWQGVCSAGFMLDILEFGGEVRVKVEATN